MITFKEYPCVVEAGRCLNKQVHPVQHLFCMGSMNPGCYANWASSDPEDLEPYEEFLQEVGHG